MIDEHYWLQGIFHFPTKKTKMIWNNFSGEGTLTVYNVRKKKLQIQSELMDSDLTACRIIKVNYLLI